MNLEILREEHHKLITNITAVAGTLENPSMELQERIQLRREFKAQLSKVIELESQLFDLVRLNLRQAT
jgi:spore coat protein CotF